MLWSWCLSGVLLGSLSSSFLHTYSINVLICRDHGDRWKMRGKYGRNEEGMGALRRQGEGRGPCSIAASSLVLTVCLHRFMTDGGRGELVPRGCHHRQAELGGGCFVSMVCVGRGSSWWSGCLASSEPILQELGGGLRVDVVGQESGQRGEPATCLDWLCSCPSPPRQMLLSSLGVGGGQGLWGLALSYA